jgi:hypothetical protein
LYLGLSHTYRLLGQYQAALEALSFCRFYDPQAECFEEKSQAYRGLGDSPQAAVSLLEGITMGVDGQVRLAAETINLYRQTAPESCALAGNALNFNCPLVRDQLCLASRNAARQYRDLGRANDAQATASGAVTSLGCPADMFR